MGFTFIIVSSPQMYIYIVGEEEHKENNDLSDTLRSNHRHFLHPALHRCAARG